MKISEKFTVKSGLSVIQVFNVIITLKEKRKTAVLLKVMIRNCLPIIIILPIEERRRAFTAV